MANGFLSQEEIDALLHGNISEKAPEILTPEEEDLIGEIGNICMGSAATALNAMLYLPVNITTPNVKVTNLKDLRKNFQTPYVALEVGYTSGIKGKNLLVIKTKDAAIIADIMMGGNGAAEDHPLSEIEKSAVSEAMNQMIGSSATAMASMFSKEINISPPVSMVWDDEKAPLIKDINEENNIVVVNFKLTIGNLVNSEIMQILPLDTAKDIVKIMTSGKRKDEDKKDEDIKDEDKKEVPAAYGEEVKVEKAKFQPLTETKTSSPTRNIDLIMDVPLEITVVLGRTKKNIKDVLSFNAGGLIQLDKLADEPVEILVNGKKVAYGEVVIVDENFGVRITSIVSSKERVMNLGK